MHAPVNVCVSACVRVCECVMVQKCSVVRDGLVCISKHALSSNTFNLRRGLKVHFLLFIKWNTIPNQSTQSESCQKLNIWRVQLRKKMLLWKKVSATHRSMNVIMKKKIYNNHIFIYTMIFLYLCQPVLSIVHPTKSDSLRSNSNGGHLCITNYTFIRVTLNPAPVRRVSTAN